MSHHSDPVESDPRVPVQVHLAFDPSDSSAQAVADRLAQAFSNGGHDPTAPALRIPVHRWPTSLGYPVRRHPADARTLVERLADAALSVVVLLVDHHMIGLETLDDEDTQRPASVSSWAELVATLDAATGPDILVIPVAIVPAAVRCFPKAGQAVRPFLDAGDRALQVVYNRVAHELARRLRPGSPQDAPETPPIQVFLSHAKSDGLGIAKALQTHFALEESMCTFYDHVDLAAGGDWQTDLLSAAGRDVLLVLWSDLYSSRAWCRRELLAARRAEIGVVVVSLAASFEPWSVPLLGNSPVVRWVGPESCGTIAEVVVREALRVGHARKVLERVRQPDERVFVHRPDPWLLLWAQLDPVRPLRPGMSALYPDPPLGPDMVRHLGTLFPHTRLVSPSTRVAPPERLFQVALSVSESLDGAAFGVTPTAVQAVAAEVTRALLHHRHTLRYGGSLTYPGEKDENAVTRLMAMVQDLADRDEAPVPLKNIVPWPLSETITPELRSRYVGIAKFQLLPAPPGVPAVSPAEETVRKTFWKPTTPAWREAWTLGLTAMREKLRSQSDVRVSVGGKLDGYAGGWPGVLEELLISLGTNQPTFLLGGFGGATRAVADVLLGRDRPELTAAWHGRDPAIAAWQREYDPTGARWTTYVATVQARAGQPLDSTLQNGLDHDDNLALIREQSIDRIVELILKGLRVLGSRPDQDGQDL